MQHAHAGLIMAIRIGNTLSLQVNQSLGCLLCCTIGIKAFCQWLLDRKGARYTCTKPTILPRFTKLADPNHGHSNME